MKVLGVILWLLLLLGAYALGAGSPARTGSEFASATSFEDALDHSDPLLRSFEISRSLRAMGADGIDEVLEAVEAAGHWFDWQEYRLLMAAWVPIDPDEAVIWAFSRPGDLEERASEAALEALGYSNPSRALHVLQSIEDRERADSLHLPMAQGWARSDFRDGLAEHLASQPRGVYRQRSTAALANEILKDGPEALFAWVDAIEVDPSTAFKQTAFLRAVTALAEVDPARAAQWIDEHLGQPYAVRAPNALARRWAEEDPAAAMSWLVSLPQENADDEPTKRIFTEWLKSDAESAEGWIVKEAPSEATDPLLRILVRRDFERSPDRAMDWAHLLHDPVARSRVQAVAGRAWYRKDREAFLAWLPDSGLERQVQDLILNTPARNDLRGVGPKKRGPTQP